MAESGQPTAEPQTVLRATARQRGLDILEEALTNLRQVSRAVFRVLTRLTRCRISGKSV